MQSNSAKFSDKAVAYGIPGVTVDGTDALAVHDAVAEGVARARAGNGPSIVEGVTMRMHGHAEHDPADYVPKEMYEEWAKKDPVELFEKVLLEAGVIDADVAAQVTEGRAAGSHRRAQAGARRSDAGSEHGRGGRICRLIRARPPIWRRWGWRWITRWSAIPTPSSSARTSASTAAPSRSPRASWTSTAPAGWSTPRSRRPVSPAWRPAPPWSGCGRSWSTSSPTSSPARSTRSSTCWPGTTTAPVTRCR